MGWKEINKLCPNCKNEDLGLLSDGYEYFCLHCGYSRNIREYRSQVAKIKALANKWMIFRLGNFSTIDPNFFNPDILEIEKLKVEIKLLELGGSIKRLERIALNCEKREEREELNKREKVMLT